MKDYYSILNLDRTANTKEIRKAYYKLARENHPDVNNALNAHEKFIEINEAYQVLKNLTHRRNYNFLYDSRKNKTNYKSRKSRKNECSGVTDCVKSKSCDLQTVPKIFLSSFIIFPYSLIHHSICGTSRLATLSMNHHDGLEVPGHNRIRRIT